MKIKGRVWLFDDNVNTDLIYPGTSFRLPIEEQCKLVFSANRPGWASEVRPGDVILAGRNFGTGSARPAAILFHALRLGGLLADSINGVFYRNCINNGFPALQCLGVREAFLEGDIVEMDLRTGAVENLRTGQCLRGIGIPDSIVQIVEAGGILPSLRREGYVE